jgi:cob(I)alamin adenosyltransferase
VGIVQFIKGDWKTGEAEAFKRFDEITHVVSGEGFTWNTQDKSKDIAAARKGWEAACKMIEDSRGQDPAYDVVILDELNIALGFDYLPIEEVVRVLANKPRELSIIVTGRGAKPELIEVADTVTEMQPIKHAFEAGIRARRGIEF